LTPVLTTGIPNPANTLSRRHTTEYLPRLFFCVPDKVWLAADVFLPPQKKEQISTSETSYDCCKCIYTNVNIFEFVDGGDHLL
jgi:hypothetical protein